MMRTAMMMLAAVGALAMLVGVHAARGQVTGQATTRGPGALGVVQRVEDTARRWTVRFQVQLFGAQPRALLPQDVVPTGPLKFEKVLFTFPLIGDTGLSISYEDRASGKLIVNARTNPPADASARVAVGYQGPTSLLVLEAADIVATNMRAEWEVYAKSWQITINESRAREIAWPDDPWRPEIAALLEPQLFVDPEHPAIQRLVREWTNGRPKTVPPYTLAKVLCGKVVEHVRLTQGEIESAGRSPLALDIGQRVVVEGLNVNGSVFAAERRTVSRFDYACLLTAVYRAAGLPARLVIAVDQQKATREALVPALRSYVEFYLLDEATGRHEWVPVDPYLQSQFSNRAPPLDQRWQHFGHFEDGEFVVPIAHHWHPPTVVLNAGPPAVWGFLPEPVVGVLDSNLNIDVFETPLRGDTPARWR
jgi:hypothetical protein